MGIDLGFWVAALALVSNQRALKKERTENLGFELKRDRPTFQTSRQNLLEKVFSFLF